MGKADYRHIMNENEQKKILEDINVGIWRIETLPGQPPQMFGDANMYAILGAEPETKPEELYQHWRSRIEPVYRSYVDNAISQLVATGQAVEVEYIWNHPHRGMTVVRCDATLFSSKETGATGMLGMHRDITDKLAGHNQEDETHHIVDNYKMSLCSRYLVKAYEDIFFVDRAARTFHPVAYGRRPALSIEDSWDIDTIIDQRVPPAELEAVHSLFSRKSMEAIIAGNGSRSVDFRRKDDFGNHSWVRGTLYPVPINGVNELMFVVQDIQNEQQLKALKAEKEDVLYSIIHPRSVIYEWDAHSGRLQVLKRDLKRTPCFAEQENIPLPELVDQLCEQNIDSSERAKARAFLTCENMHRCARDQRKRSITLLLDSAHHKYCWIKVFILPSSLSNTRAYLVLEMMDRKEGLYPILESYLRETVDYCYCVDLKTGYFFRVVGDEGAKGMPPKEGYCYTQAMEEYVDRFVVEEERNQVKKLMNPECIFKTLETEPEYAFEENVIEENGEIRKKRLTCRPFHQSKAYVLLQRMDITELSNKEQMLETAQRESVTDPLTQVYNRLGGRRLILEALEKTKESENAAMILLDLDHFKEVNDQFGHPVGDWILQEAARRLQDCFRAGDIICRLGGDEYMVFLKNISRKSNIHPVLARLEKKLRLVFEKGGQKISVTASVGAAFYKGQSYEELYKQADIALYRAKKEKCGYALFGEREEEI